MVITPLMFIYLIKYKILERGINE